jgi:hypothetical protein
VHFELQLNFAPSSRKFGRGKPHHLQLAGGEIVRCSVEWYVLAYHCYQPSTNRPSQLSREDEAATGDEVEVRREDQDKINKFSRLHQRELLVEEELQGKSVRIRPLATMGPGQMLT